MPEEQAQEQTASVDVKQIGTDAESVTSQIMNVKAIQNDAMNAIALTLYRTAREILKKIDDFCNPVIDAANKAHRQAIAQRSTLKGNLEAYTIGLKKKIDQYATMKAAEERRKIYQQQAAIQKAAEDSALEQAMALEEAAGRVSSIAPDKASELKALAETRLADSVAPELSSAAIENMKKVNAATGTSVRTVWKWKVVDESLIPREYFKLDEVAINNVIRLKKDQHGIPGIDAYPESSVGMRR